MKINIQVGKLSETHRIYRVSLDSELKSESGFGSKPGPAIDDFIRRNKSSLLDKIFEEEK